MEYIFFGSLFLGGCWVLWLVSTRMEKKKYKTCDQCSGLFAEYVMQKIGYSYYCPAHKRPYERIGYNYYPRSSYSYYKEMEVDEHGTPVGFDPKKK